MFPRLAMHDPADSRDVDIETPSQCGWENALHAQRTDLTNKCVGQLNHAVRFTLRRAFRMLLKSGALLCCHISHVVLRSAEKQMIGANTTGVVAVMANIQPIRDRSVMNFPGDAMGIKVGLIGTTDATVSMRERAYPFPARIGLVDFCPEPCFKRWGFRVLTRWGVCAVGFAATLAALCDRIIHVGTPNRATGHAHGCFSSAWASCCLHYNTRLGR